MSVFLRNRKAYYDYEIIERYEAGVKLQGQEVKSIREGRGNLRGSFVRQRNGEIWLNNFTLPPYSKAGILFGYKADRPRKLLLSEKEIQSLTGKTERQGYTLVPLKLYSKNRLIKVELGLARGRKRFEKKEYLIKKQEEKRIISHKNL